MCRQNEVKLTETHAQHMRRSSARSRGTPTNSLGMIYRTRDQRGIPYANAAPNISADIPPLSRCRDDQTPCGEGLEDGQPR